MKKGVNNENVEVYLYDKDNILKSKLVDFDDIIGIRILYIHGSEYIEKIRDQKDLEEPDSEYSYLIPIEKIKRMNELFHPSGPLYAILSNRNKSIAKFRNALFNHCRNAQTDMFDDIDLEKDSVVEAKKRSSRDFCVGYNLGRKHEREKLIGYLDGVQLKMDI